MKKLFSFIAVLLCCVSMSFAQINFVATLAHDGEFTQFYGSEALVSAYNAAVNGDIITLTSGTFTAPTFDKGITVRGVGIDEAEKTLIAEYIKIQSTDSTQVTTFEGLSFDERVYVVNHPTSPNGQGTLKFIKCKFKDLYNENSSNSDSELEVANSPIVRLYNVVVTGQMLFGIPVNTCPNFVSCNSYIQNPVTSTKIKDNPSTFVNCVIEYSTGAVAYHLSFYNCIFNKLASSSADNLASTTSCYNCLSNNRNLISNLLYSSNNHYIASISDIFKTYTEGYTDGETFELNDEIKTLYSGTDNTEVGMQGGNYPFTTTVQYPIITKFQPEATTDKDGKLSINLEVDGK